MAIHKAFSALEARLNALQEAEGVALLSANSLWPQKGEILDDYLALIENHYDALVEPVDYTDDDAREAARERINSWVADRTREKIQDLAPPGILDALTQLVLVNAVYFKGDWSMPFEEAATAEAPFHLTTESQISVPMMQQEDRFGYAETEDLQILELPYGNGDLSMLLVLPRDIGGLEALEARLDIDALSLWRMRMRRQKVKVHLPRFKLSDAFRLDETLKGMGMTAPFSPEKANFAGIDGHEDRLYITAALHKAFVEVNEAGTEAAAATAVVVGARSIALPEAVPVFRADHPFLFLIQEKQTGAVLFMGRVADPAA
jgi:serpin B